MFPYVNAISLYQLQVGRARVPASSSWTKQTSHLQSRFTLHHCYRQTKGSPSQNWSQCQVSKGKRSLVYAVFLQRRLKKFSYTNLSQPQCQRYCSCCQFIVGSTCTGGENTSNKLTAIKIFANIYDLLIQQDSLLLEPVNTCLEICLEKLWS